MGNVSYYANKKVIVTGGAGFIGSHLCEELVRIGANVISLDDFSAGKELNVAFLRDYKNFTSIKKNITETEGMDELFDGVDTVFNNAASKKNICLIDPKRDLRVNAEGVLNLLEFSLKHKVRKFVHASTGSVYGEPIEFPSTEDHPLRPVSYYGVSKLAGERYVDVFHKLYGLNTTILRYFHVYGPRQESNEFGGVVSIFLRNILEEKPLVIFGDGKQERSFTWVKDLVSANIEAGINTNAEGQVYNVASGIRVTINELAVNMKKMMDSSVAIIYDKPLVGDIMHFDVSNCKITSDLGITFEKDFWGTLNMTLNEFVEYLKKIPGSNNVRNYFSL
jgi:nucleoside-diphosphate-sugar epimerase